MSSMVRYSVDLRSKTEPRVVDADDYTIDDGMITFRDEIGRAIVSLPLAEVGSEFEDFGEDDDPIFVARRELVALQRESALRTIRAEVEAEASPGNRQTRRHPPR